ncbi:MAG: hypothetical protein Tsb005_02170 [Gammaproteobacteria bacterium]
MNRYLIIILCSLAMSGCGIVNYFSPRKPTVEQGNIIVDEQVTKIKKGMTEAEVANIMGNPVLTNVLDPDHWNYVYTLRKGKQGLHKQRKVLIYFNRRGRVTDIIEQ